MKFVVVLLALIGNIQVGLAQDTTRLYTTRYVLQSDVDRELSYRFLDSTIDQTEIFHPLYRNPGVFQDLGNIGTASRNLLFDINRETGFSASFNPYEAYVFKSTDAKFYNTTKPFTELFYTQGSQEMMFLKVKHAQNILPRWSFGVDYQRITSQGFLLRQNTSHYNLLFNTRYYSKNKRYELLGVVGYNKALVDENGGIGNDSTYEALTGANKSVRVNLNASNNKYLNRFATVRQYYKFGEASTVINEEDTLYAFKTRWQLMHQIKVEDERHIFINAGDTLNFLLPNQYFTSTENNTYDSLYFGKLTNDFAFQYVNQEGKKGYRFAEFMLQHQALVISQPGYVRNFQNSILSLKYEHEKNANYTLSYKTSANYTLSGFNQGDFRVYAAMRYRAPKWDVHLGLVAQQYKPDYTFFRFNSNQFIWENNFKAVQNLHPYLRIQTRKLKHNAVFSLHLFQLNNWAYLDSNLLPAQFTGNIQIVQARIEKTFQLGKFYFHHKLYWQKSNHYSLPLPEFSGMVRYYFQTKFYNSTLQLGFDAFYNTAFNAMGWSPASRMFYAQERIRVGNYPIIDPFLCMMIKRAVVFFKLEHANMNIVNEGFYYTPHYPVSLQSFRMGVKWRMFD